MYVSVADWFGKIVKLSQLAGSAGGFGLHAARHAQRYARGGGGGGKEKLRCSQLLLVKDKAMRLKIDGMRPATILGAIWL